MMFFRSAVLGSAVIVASAWPANLQHVVDDANIKVRGATMEPISRCPATTSRTFHHDQMRKDRRASATFHFDPPRDGCYIIEERTELDAILWNALRKCEASANAKVHVHYCKGLQAAGTVDQTPKGFGRQPQDQWTYIAALQFYKGRPGNVTLSNEGTEPGTLTLFDQVRFSWSGKDCFQNDAHPRKAEMRFTIDFEHVADRLTVFGIALKKRLAEMAGIPEDSLRLNDLRSGSVIAEFVVLPSVVDDPATGLVVGSPAHSIELLRSAVSENAGELCALSGAPLEGCNVQLADVGFAGNTVKVLPVPKSDPEQRTQQTDTQAETDDVNNVIIAVCAVAGAGLLLVALLWLYMSRALKTKISDPNSRGKTYEIKVQSSFSSMEEGHSAQEKKPMEQDGDGSTACPTPSVHSDRQSEGSLCGNSDTASTPESVASVVKAKSAWGSSTGSPERRRAAKGLEGSPPKCKGLEFLEQ